MTGNRSPVRRPQKFLLLWSSFLSEFGFIVYSRSFYEMQRLSNSDSTFPQNPPAQSVNSVHEKRSRLREKRMINWFGVKENKTPGGEQYLDPPGVELLPWL
jgi:hypothetical protein